MANINAYLRKDGRWEVRMYTRADQTGKRKYRSVYGKTKDEAEKKTLYYYNVGSRSQSSTKMTVNNLILEYIQRKQPRLKASTLANYRMKYEKHIIPILGEICCTAITADNIYRFKGGGTVARGDSSCL